MLKNLSIISFFTLFSFITSSAYAIEWNQNDLKFILGVDYSSGKYGMDESTDMLYVPLEIKYRALPWQFSTTIPYIRITGPGGVVGGGGGGVIPVGNGSSSGDSGQGGGNEGGQGGGHDGGQGGGHDGRQGGGQVAGNGSGNRPGNGQGPGNGHGPGPGPGHGGDNSADVQRFTEQGLGDILLEVNYALDMVQPLPFYADLGAIVKLPTADKDKGLGTGEFDLALQLDVSKIYYSDKQIETTPFVTVGYRFMGDPDEIDFNDVWFSSIGVDFKFRASTHVGLSYDYRQAITPGTANVSEALLYYDYRFDKSWSVSAYGVLGFADGSPDQAIGLQLKFIPD